MLRPRRRQHRRDPETSEPRGLAARDLPADRADGQPEGAPQVAIDPHGAGMHQQVVISSDGAAARKAVGDEKSPARWLVIGVVDESEPGVRV